MVVGRYNRNRMLGLEDDSSQWVTGTKDMMRVAVKYFENLFTASDLGGDDRVIGLVEKRISRNMNEKLLQKFTKDDTWLAVKSMAPLKAPGSYGFCIDEAQGAFILGRQISDNTLIAYEVIHFLKMKKKGKHGNFALKLDLSKAYDRVERDFLARILSRLGFHQDCFGDTSAEGVCSVRNILKDYELVLGQKINLGKSLIYFGANVGEAIRSSIIDIMGVKRETNPEKYLSLPMMVGRKKRWAFSNFADHFRKRIAGWSFRYLSMGGKEVFIKVVLQALPIYIMQCFALLKTFCHQLEGILNKFWWANNKTSKGIHWSTWSALCLPKVYGGMGFRDLCLFNKALLAKQNDPWIRGPGNGRLLVHSMDINWTIVDQFLNDESDTWKKEVIYRLFDDKQARCILNIPLAGSGSSDMLVWWHDASGEYSVKSGYRSLLTNVIQQTVTTGHTIENYKNIFTSIWDLQIPAKMKIHLWSLFKNYVPHFLNLVQRRLHVDSSYVQDSSFYKTKGLSRVTKRNVLWRPPKSGVIKLNFDASFASNTNFFISAVLARDSVGQIMGACSYPLLDVANTFVAEARACEKALCFALDMGFRKVVLEGDSLKVIKKLNSNIVDRFVLSPISQHIQVLAGSFEEVTYLFVPREANKAAHELAMVGRNRKLPCFWVEEAPLSVIEAVESDRYEWFHRC
ncbi:uncharacterized protein LOC105772032 [Gossypium raimondii]|uniref:uncharacterized protein LOC105772032 n=1 Tax=Gossypium raimondii TaxID=29730 RepID=UPI00063A94E3|nr:uncharacterized protein LOC105772032 [Gossypium raimondii]